MTDPSTDMRTTAELGGRATSDGRDAHDNHERAIGDVLEDVARRHPDRTAVIAGDRVVSWAALDSRARALGADLRARIGSGPAKVGVCLRSGPEFLEAYFGCFKASIVPFNINFRYTTPEIAYLLVNADATAVVVGEEFAEAVIEAARETPDVVAIYVVPDDEVGGSLRNAPRPHGSPEILDFERIGADAHTGGPLDVSTGPDDLLFLYTGGTTGMPKATMWRHGDLTSLYGGGLVRAAGIGGSERTEPVRSLSAAPMMHGTGLLSQLSNLMGGGTVVIPPPGRFDPEAVWDTVEADRVEVLTIVGDPFARPLLDALEHSPGRWDLHRLQLISSSGAMWSLPVKDELLRHLPDTVLYDAFSASEGARLGGTASRAGANADTGRFVLGSDARVLADDDTWVEPGSGVAGRIAVSGHLPVGYYKDPVKTAETFREIDGVRYAVPGDYVTVGTDGRVTLLGRGSSVINTGGEKVYAEEVEESLKSHPDVRDAAVLGAPDPRFGQVVCAVVVTTSDDWDRTELADHVRGHLAPYKVPREFIRLDTLGRAPNGKLDRRRLDDLVERRRRGEDHQPR